ncbi:MULTISPECIES: glycerol-3-phosphate 1-O-acyltransferase PlsY [Rhizobium]|uniref:Glycerol-3-phosphate acyltransferase n=1 Tax=Rhizobium rhododendri TaxID=2506430 RepID=A0ABY8IP65_9HYPH|nr:MULTISPECIES: glycerol-3-phosphate 1-O-acyltransferase PlsY [Rhizobium]MBO9133085.1 glycerol-3-phosphate 1-O-acyltransferase PlsY [Rhizobium sp. B209b/85]MBO9168283.1 glycerol-3-phosphate 1-O-acyltransferase PlsY [Rhizobium sp. L245/93]MBO9184329.1 glycerol-3-phosphate 1-O-acyltransferase PlsY [Rhizobium sp. E27B/91]MBZ5759984.1 glycerol-3-phosphate 1-O-acyltransferase PlsY [Rhizobium sp. VS19-DR96]MBZ5766535.1 glycerol-3-phosphate 1-O-acyltransferase PlsY [Rhizobium sp. VS19-DR129.2]
MNWQITVPLALAALAIGYLLGSIPFGLVLTRMAGLGDVRSIGSGSIGATNVLRTGSKKLAVATMLLDALKGTLAAFVCTRLFGAEAGLLAGFAAFIGHIFPVWIGFRGGKGVATYIGILLALAPVMVLLFAVVWLTCAFLSRYSSLSALVATLVIPVALWIVGPDKIAAAMTLMSLICWWKHKANIARLTAGTESKIGSKG